MPGATSSQEPAAPDTAAPGALPFRRGQWGAEVGLFSGLRGGLLRFSTPTRAWLLDLSVSGSAESSTSDGRTVTSGLASVQLRIGRRAYRPLLRRTGSSDARVAAFGAFGGSVGGYWTASGGLDSRQSRVGVGVFVEPGATAFVTDYLALSAAVEAILEGEYGSSSYTSPTGDEEKAISRRVRVGIGAVRLFGSVFF